LNPAEPSVFKKGAEKRIDMHLLGVLRPWARPGAMLVVHQWLPFRYVKNCRAVCPQVVAPPKAAPQQVQAEGK